MELDDTNARTGIGLSIILYSRATESYSPEMKAWESLMMLDQPDVWDSHPDPDHDGYEVSKKPSTNIRALAAKSDLQWVVTSSVDSSASKLGYRPSKIGLSRKSFIPPTLGIARARP